MCVVAFAWNCHPRWRLVLMGNRDEFHARPSAALARWPGTGMLAGRDLQAGGSWAGVDARGRCAVVTNVRDRLASAVNARSRGDLPVAYLQGDPGAEAWARRLLAEAGAYAPFNLLLTDSEECVYLGNHPRIETRRVSPGIHGMSNGGFDVPWPKTTRLCAELGEWLQGDTQDPAPLWDAMREESSFPDDRLPDTGVGLELERRLSPVFISGPGYGTRASTVVAIGHDGAGWIGERRFGPDGRSIGETVLHYGPYSRS